MKWSGSKTSQSDEIIKYIPNIKNYYEPFIGGGSIFLKLLENSSNIENYYISDINSDLINIYNLMKNNPNKLISDYSIHHKLFNSKDINYRKEYFYKIRKEYNENRNPSDFYFIMRSTTNGMPRYNKNGDFNNSCHFSRPAMSPNKVKKIILKWYELFNKKNVNFYISDYKDILYKDFCYLDPPYENINSMYFSNFNNLEFITWLNKLNCKWLLSYNGKINDNLIKHNPPKYKTHKFLKSGNSSFRRVIGNTNDSIIYESIYMNY